MPVPDIASSAHLDAALDRLTTGGDLTADEIRLLAESPDILPTGMLADTVRRRVNGTAVTFLRVALVDVAGPLALDMVPPAARDVRLTGTPATLQAAAERISAVKAIARDRTVSGLSWSDVDGWASAHGGHARVLAALRGAGLDALAELPLDLVSDVAGALDALADAGFSGPRLTMSKAMATADRLRLLLNVAPLVNRSDGVSAIAPLPLSLNALRPTTGYDDVKAVALARLALPRVPHVQVDWLRYGPKLAQVALTFGADDIDNVSSSDEAPDGRRRAPVEELRKNIESAGFTAIERDARYVHLA